MSYRLTITASDMREINRSAILEIIRRESPISRSAIAERLDVSLPTVMRIVDELVAEGFVRPEGSTEWSGGRRRPLLEFNAEGFVVIGVDMGGTKLYGAISDLGGNILDEIDMGRHRTTGEGNYDRLIELIDALLASPKLAGRKVRGIGRWRAGDHPAQGGDCEMGVYAQLARFSAQGTPGRTLWAAITVDNDVNLAAMGELWFGAGQNVQNMILIVSGEGIGAGIIIDGALYRGGSEASGEIGNFIPGREFLGKTTRISARWKASHREPASSSAPDQPQVDAARSE